MNMQGFCRKNYNINNNKKGLTFINLYTIWFMLESNFRTQLVSYVKRWNDDMLKNIFKGIYIYGVVQIFVGTLYDMQHYKN